MLYFKSCPRCQTGTVEYSSDSWGQYLQCLNCGLMKDLPDGADPKASLAQIRREINAAIADETTAVA